MDDWIRRMRDRIGTDLMFVPSAVGWVLDPDGRVLLQKRSATEDVWGFPGGILDLGESFEEGAVREIREETGLIVKATRLLGVYSKFFETCANGDQCQTVTALFEMVPVGGALQVDDRETFALRYFAPTDFPPLYYEQHRAMLRDRLAGGAPAFR